MSADRYLRSWGFAIHGRPKDGPPTWRDRLTGRVMDQDAAVAKAKDREAKAEARKR